MIRRGSRARAGITLTEILISILIMGVGLVSLHERASELGGRSEVTCPATGGTVVRAWLPLRRNA